MSEVEEKGRKTLVLLSGGLDSVAALHAAIEDGRDVRAIGFRYAQPHANQELHAAGVIAVRLGVPFSVAQIIDLPTRLDPTPGLVRSGISRAFLPGRNMLFLTLAAMEAAKQWPGERVDLMIGANLNDASGFPDCRAEFFETATHTLSTAFAGSVSLWIRAPWLTVRKAEIVAWAKDRPLALRDIRDSVSCYRGIRCGSCDACALRAQAFIECGIADGDAQYRMTGGDPARDAAFGSVAPSRLPTIQLTQVDSTSEDGTR